MDFGPGITIGPGIAISGPPTASFVTPFSAAVTTNYTNTSFALPGLYVFGNGSIVKFKAKRSKWATTSKFDNMILMPSGTSGTFTPGGWFTMNFTTASAWTIESGDTYVVTVTGDPVTYFLSDAGSPCDNIATP